ncbi:hypothetical protein DSO57_1000839 [Entomophthora muscae]|uniref:Uncharacterized protein n=1 Tax=Entomophthora muscae TaxID=34485 RepID=A0ACC2U746_9FUNG|nr:hypothetical protein DSO57_1000839 [Entomophthora muscae]
MQTLSGYKFKYKFVKGELNILPNLLSHNPAMYLVRGNKDPQVTVILESSILLESGPPFPKPRPRLQLLLHSSWSLVLLPHLRHSCHWLSLLRFCTTSWWPSTPPRAVRLSALSFLLTLRPMVTILLRIR